MYFQDWNVPKGSGGERRYAQIDPMYDCECLDPELGSFVSGGIELDTHVDKY